VYALESCNGIPYAKFSINNMFLNVNVWKTKTDVYVKFRDIDADMYTVQGDKLIETGILGKLHLPKTWMI